MRASRAVRPAKEIAHINAYPASFYAPLYLPQLKTDEKGWAHVKRQVARQLVYSNDEMKQLALGALRRIQNLPE